MILEVNSWQSAALEGMHDIYYGTELPPNRKPIPIVKPDDRIGEPYLRCDPEKIIAIVETDTPRPQFSLHTAGREFAARSPATSSNSWGTR